MARKLPKMCRHKRSNRAYVTDPFTQQEHYLGVWGSVEAQKNYDAWIQALLARRQEVASGAPAGGAVTVARLILDFLDHARRYYMKGGKVTTEVSSIEQALTPVNELYGTLEADKFGPKELKAVRLRMIEKGWARRNINKQVQRIRRMFRWGVEHGLVKTEALAALATVPGLRRGRTPARETAPIEPVPEGVLEAVLPRLAEDVRAMVLIQLHADMRPGEVVILRPCDLDRSDEPWLYTPHTHKTEHHGRQRRVFLGPRARQILAPYLLKCPADDAWLFPSEGRGKNLGIKGHWTVAGYRRAIRTACDKDPPLPYFHPNQIRHTAATAIRAEYGIEAAQAVLGHANLSTSEIYAHKSEALAQEIAEKFG